MPATPAAPSLPPFDPVSLGKRLRNLRDKHPEKPPFVTLLIGAGFSASTGIPVASEIVAELEKEIAAEPLYAEAANGKQDGVSDYARLMAALCTPQARAEHIRDYVDRARDPHTKALKINWAHLLLASLVEHKYIRRILTTNFDPLVVEALALLGQPIRTFDLNTTGHYDSDILGDGTVVYLHGQMHSLLLANADPETRKIQPHYRAVLQEAIRDSFLLVVGYSGDCDPVLDALTQLPTFPNSLWWSQHSSGEPGEGVRRLFESHANACRLSTGDDADLFMRKLVLEGINLDIPEIVTKPFIALEKSLLRIASPLPALSADTAAPDPDLVAGALALVRKAQEEANPTNSPAAVQTSKASAATPPTNALQDLQLKVRLDEAALAGNWETFDKLAQGIPADLTSPVSQAVGGGFLRRADANRATGALAEAQAFIAKAQQYGVSRNMTAWIPATVGNIHYAQAELQGNSPEASRLFAAAGAKYAEAIRIKPDMHAAFYNWGSALADHAKLQGNSPEADRLFAAAGAKYAEAIRLKPDYPEAFNNWGNALADLARCKGNSSQADHLLACAIAKYAEALRLKPGWHEPINSWGHVLAERAKLKGNSAEADRRFADACAKFAEAIRLKPDYDKAWGNLACVHALQGNVPDCLAALIQWKAFAPAATRKILDNDHNFDRVRNAPEFVAFRETLPEG